MAAFFMPMISRFLLIALIALSATACRERKLAPPRATPVSEDGKLSLRLMTFNVRYENGEDLDSRSWKQRVAGAVRLIRAESPAVFGVQEALHGQAADLWASLPDYEFFGVGRDDGKTEGEYSGVFYQRDRFDADANERGTIWLSDTPATPGSKTWGNEIPRVVTWIKLTDRASGRSFYVFNTHWDHRNQPSREKAAKLIASRIDGRRDSKAPVILLGDFNAVEGNPGVSYLTGRPVKLDGAESIWTNGLVDTFQAVHPNSSARTTLHFWSADKSGNRKIDHILASKGVKILSADVRDQPMVSDHFPVTAEVEFR